MRVIFMGTPEFAVFSLKALVEAGFDVCLAVTAPDKPAGRGCKMTESEVKRYAAEHNIEVFQPQTLKNTAVKDKLDQYNADVIVVTAYGKILPQEILSLTKFGCINVHASLLPRHRGAAPINRAVIEGDSVGGVSVMYMDAGIDTGDVLLTESIEIPFEACVGDYYDSLAEISGNILIKALKQLENGTAARIKQDDSKATYAAKLTDGDRLIDLSKSSIELYNGIRGLSPYPCAYTFIDGKRIKIYKAHIASENESESDGIGLVCRDGKIIVTELQPEGKRRMSAHEYLLGKR